MKNTFLFIIALSITTRISYAQLNIGLKLNWTVNNFIFKTADGEKISKSVSYQNMYPSNDFDFTLSGGAMANYKLSHRFSIQSELILNTAKTGFAEMTLYTDSYGDTKYTYNVFDVKMQYMEIPVMGKVSFGNKVTFDIIAGGFAGYLLSAKQSTETGILNIPEDSLYGPSQGADQFINYPTHNVRTDYTKFNAGLLLGCGITMRDRLIFEIRVTRGLVNINKSGPVKLNTLQGQFTVGYYIFRQKKKTDLHSENL